MPLALLEMSLGIVEPERPQLDGAQVHQGDGPGVVAEHHLVGCLGRYRVQQRLHLFRDGADVASKFLARRGLGLLPPYPNQIRYTLNAVYLHDDKTKTQHPSMVVKLAAPDACTFTLHRTFLDYEGRKADVPEVRKLAPGPVPPGGAVRLCPSASYMGVGTGLETSLAAMEMFKLPVWATLNDRLLLKWQPPATVRRLVIFGDNDKSFSGQMAAYGLAFRLKTEGLMVEVRIPERVGWDWNDQLMDDKGIAPSDRLMESRQEADHASDNEADEVVESKIGGL